jgi:hypothetical protein
MDKRGLKLSFVLGLFVFIVGVLIALIPFFPQHWAFLEVFSFYEPGTKFSALKQGAIIFLGIILAGLSIRMMRGHFD